MDMTLSHTTALDVIRLPGFPRLLARSADLPCELPASMPTGSEVFEARERFRPLADAAASPHVLVATPGGCHQSPYATAHTWSAPLPPGSTVRLLPGLSCVSPLLLPVLMAPRITKYELAMLLAELLGTYAIRPSADGGLTSRNEPLITKTQLIAYLDQLGPRRGTHLVRDALEMAPERAASPMEGKLFLRATRRFASGGYRLAEVTLNDPVVLAALSDEVEAFRIRKPDLLLLAPEPEDGSSMPFRGVALDYYGRWHKDPDQVMRDTERANELLAGGFKDYVLWKENYDDIDYFDGVMRFARRDLGLPDRKLSSARAKSERSARIGLWAELERIDGVRWSLFAEKNDELVAGAM